MLAELNEVLDRLRFFCGTLILEKVFRNDYVAACSTALSSATEENESGGHLDVPCLSKLTQHKSTADWLNF